MACGTGGGRGRFGAWALAASLGTAPAWAQTTARPVEVAESESSTIRVAGEATRARGAELDYQAKEREKLALAVTVHGP